MQRHELEDWLCRFGIAMIFAAIIALHWQDHLGRLIDKLWSLLP